MKNLLTQHGRRWPVLAAKLTSLWLAGVALLAACWLALAVSGPVLRRLDHLPAPHQSLAQAVSLAASQLSRALLVLAMFAAIGLLSATLTRNTIGTMAATAGILVAMLLAASWPGLGRWSPATWVQSWMRFPAGLASVTFLPANFWSRFISASGTPPPAWAGLSTNAGSERERAAFGKVRATLAGPQPLPFPLASQVNKLSNAVIFSPAREALGG